MKDPLISEQDLYDLSYFLEPREGKYELNSDRAIEFVIVFFVLSSFVGDFFFLLIVFLFSVFTVRPQPPRPALLDSDASSSNIDWKTVIESNNHSIEWKEALVEVDSLRMPLNQKFSELRFSCVRVRGAHCCRYFLGCDYRGRLGESAEVAWHWPVGRPDQLPHLHQARLNLPWQGGECVLRPGTRYGSALDCIPINND